MKKIYLLSLFWIGSLFAQQNALDQTLHYAEGHAIFRDIFFKEHEQEFLRLVKEGQSPKTLFIGCSDSRVTPELISNATKPGTLFVVRTAGNFVPVLDQKVPYDGVAATIEYAVNVLGVQDIIVCGHSHCGAIEGLFSDEISRDPKFKLIAQWLQFGYPARDLVNKANFAPDNARERFSITERVSVLYQLQHLLSFPFIKEKVAADTLHLHGWHFDIEQGKVTYWDPKSYEFKTLMR